MPITVKSTGGGSVTLTAPVTASDLTLTLPSSSGTVALASSQSFADATFTGTTTFPGSGTWDSSGNVGIGTSSPGYRLDVQANSASQAWASFKNTNAAGTGGFFLGNDSFSDIGAIGAQGSSGSAFGGANSIYVGTWRAYPLAFITNNTERARIDSSGNLLVGTTSLSISSGSGVKIRPAQDGAVACVDSASTSASTSYVMYSTGASAYRFYVNWAGTVFATSTTISAISDQRLKENIRDLDDGLEKVMALKPRKFDWKEGKGANIKDARGFIAQEFEQVFPDMIDTWKDPAPEGEEPYKAVNANLIPTLVKAIQEQQAQITELKAEIATLKGAA